MSKLLVYLDGELVGEQQLDRERIMIGRKPNNDLQLAHNAVSSSHAMIITIRNDSFLEDLNSTNGTKVNGKSIKKYLLRDGDEIKLAKHSLKYVFEPLVIKPENDGSRRSEKLRYLDNLIQSADDTLATQEESLLHTQGFPSATQGQTHSGNRPTGRTSSGELPMAGLQILSGVGAGKEMDLDRTLTTLGKPGIQVAVITRHEEGYTLTHLEGTQAPLLNGIAVSGPPHVLEDHDIIEIAGIKLAFHLKRSPTMPASGRQGVP
ncbi:FHA domain-containing protein [Sulfuricella denitrificans skB26]|uniref:FHA domain-containing protein n=1 Tax=Sulfuricella denitrificans (strain DSM 22764 / NBRC 105220 / skB26) TaxID=1163617 RepID=S6AHH1_SULDS|nr:FHA domain-containing protein [Sulfuricella denitrificans]BAN35596.1 FHA domain-containing protein [Sulfuricella denitrificans skB26]